MPFYSIALSAKPNIMLSQTTTLESLQDSYKGYLASEKLDGVRGYWNGENLISRAGNIIHAPTWFIKDFPNVPLEGELWTGRGQFDLVSGIIRKQTPIDSEWQNVKFMLFDAPKSQLIFSQRMDYIENLISPLNISWLKLIPHHSFEKYSQLIEHYNKLVNNNAEGLMLNKADAYYQSGRTDKIIKLKPFTDKEAIVVRHLLGKGKYKNMMGSLLVKDKNGREFKIGSGFSDQQRQKPPKIGDIISYRYTGTTKTGLPRFPVFIRIRSDMEEL
jgi:DNA ligase-1